MTKRLLEMLTHLKKDLLCTISGHYLNNSLMLALNSQIAGLLYVRFFRGFVIFIQTHHPTKQRKYCDLEEVVSGEVLTNHGVDKDVLRIIRQ